jgi:hypothetical protein
MSGSSVRYGVILISGPSVLLMFLLLVQGADRVCASSGKLNTLDVSQGSDRCTFQGVALPRIEYVIGWASAGRSGRRLASIERVVAVKVRLLNIIYCYDIQCRDSILSDVRTPRYC